MKMATTLQLSAQPSRTSSSRRAKLDCESCRSEGISCDRSRPRCLNCKGRKLACSGYKVDLAWQSGIASRGNLAGFNYPHPALTTSQLNCKNDLAGKKSRWRGKSSKTTGERLFKFVEGKPVKSKGRVGGSSPKADVTDLGPRVIPDFSDCEVQDILPSVSLFEIHGSNMPTADTPGYSVDREYELSEPSIIIDQQSSLNSWLLPRQGAFNQEEADESVNVVNVVNESQLSVPAIVPFETLDQQFNHILSCYDQHICAIPLTADCFLNPFRVLRESYNVSKHLRHAIMATSLFHLNRNKESTESATLVISHQSESLSLYSQALNGLSCQNTGVQFLDTALLLMYLDSAQCAVGLYHIHLQGIRGIIDSHGGESSLIPHSSRLRAQLAMFIWYDATIALLARGDLVLPLSYLEATLQYGKADGWNYLDLSGCQEEFVVIMARIARLAQQHEMALGKENLYFDMCAVDQVEDALRRVTVAYPIFDQDADEEALDVARDRYHCSEAWRNALLLYIVRVFRWTRGSPVPTSVRYLARTITEHARCMRKENTYQKQILLPLFLAGAEMKREEDKCFLKSYCSWWTQMCGSKMFIDAYSFCEEIWSAVDGPESQWLWWGTIVDRRCSESGLPVRPQVLLG